MAGYEQQLLNVGAPRYRFRALAVTRLTVKDIDMFDYQQRLKPRSCLSCQALVLERVAELQTCMRYNTTFRNSALMGLRSYRTQNLCPAFLERSTSEGCLLVLPLT